MELSLGTAQWGTAYGVTNSRGRLTDEDVRDVVFTAISYGVASVDTHRSLRPEQGYGDAQARLRRWAAQFAITTKVFGGPEAALPMEGQLKASLRELGLDSVERCLVHDWYALTGEQARRAATGLTALLDAGEVRSVGISAYELRDIERAAEIFPDMTSVQIPVSVLDQRFVLSSMVREVCDREGMHVQARSAFLQGLLLAPASTAALADHPDVWRFHASCSRDGLDPLHVCLAYLRSIPWIDEVVVGVTSAAELQAICEAWGETEDIDSDWADWASHDEDLLDPRRWKR